jgi:transcription antitermination protein NusB
VIARDAAALRQGRTAALQMLYQWEVGRVSAHEAVVTYWPARDAERVGSEDVAAETPAEAEAMPAALQDFANALVHGTIERVAEIDGLITAQAQNWRIERMAVLDRLVLRLAVFEMLTAADTPSRVIINEALELARAYSGEEAVGFVNGILDAVRKQLRRD